MYDLMWKWNYNTYKWYIRINSIYGWDL